MMDEFQAFLTDKLGLSKGDKILLAVSGGKDSMVMLDLFAKTQGYEIGVAHCNFRLRGEEANEDAAFVEKICQAHKLPFYLKHFETKRYAFDQKIGIQEAARELRYSWFDELCEQLGYQYIAVAHHLDDQVETVLFNMCRGSHLRGMGGIPLVRDKIIRPLMFAWRKDIHAYYKAENLLIREDSSNQSDHYKRNFLRHNVIDNLRKVNHRAKEHIVAMSLEMQEIRASLDSAYMLENPSFLHRDGQLWQINLNALAKQIFQGEFLFRALKEYGFSAGESKEIMALVGKQSGKTFIGRCGTVWKNRDGLIMAPKSPASAPATYFIEKDLNVTHLPVNLQIKRVPIDELVIKRDPKYLWLDANELEFPLSLRLWEPGDRIRPFGMKGAQKLSDLFVQNKLSPHQKNEQWVLLSGPNIIWVLGLRTSRHFPITESTKEALEISVL